MSPLSWIPPRRKPRNPAGLRKMTSPRAAFLPRSRMWEGPQRRAGRCFLWSIAAILYFAIVLVIAFSIPLPRPTSPSVEINGKRGIERPAKSFRF